MTVNNFDALLADLDAGHMNLPEDAEETSHAGFAKAMAFERAMAEMDDAHQRISAIRFPKRTKADHREILRHQIREADQLLKAALDGGAIQRGEMTGEQAVHYQTRLHKLGDAVDRDETAPVAHGPSRPGPLPDNVHPATFKTALMRAMTEGRVTPTDAARCEAGLIRGEAPPKELLNRILGA